MAQRLMGGNDDAFGDDNDRFYDDSDDDDSTEHSKRFSPRSCLIWLLVGATVLVVAVIAVKSSVDSMQPSSSTSASGSSVGATPSVAKNKSDVIAESTSGVGLSDAGSVYCFMVMLPFGHERRLVQLQYERSLGIFTCDEHVVLSNETFALSPGMPDSEKSVTFPGSMVVNFNNWTWKIYNVKLALNTDVFLRAWRKVFELGRWRNFAWTVKAEADVVLFPDRLRYLLRTRPLVPPPSPAASEGTCDVCLNTSESMHNKSCIAHVTWMQKDGLTCAEALDFVARPPPLDCGCSCQRSACNKPESVYLRNCAVNKYRPDDPYPFHALHGPLEVLSIAAVKDLEAGLGDCEIHYKSKETQWGEDWFLEHCLRDMLGVNPIDSFSSLMDGDCACVAWPCEAPHAAFQPFKKEEAYLQCTANALKNGTWPPTDPQYAEHKRWSKRANMWITQEYDDRGIPY